MKSHPLIFTGDSVRKILSKSKTQTRRLFAARDIAKVSPLATFHHLDGMGNAVFTDNTCLRVWDVGDTIWVKEAWCAADIMIGLGSEKDPPQCIGYRATVVAYTFRIV